MFSAFPFRPKAAIPNFQLSFLFACSKREMSYAYLFKYIIIGDTGSLLVLSCLLFEKINSHSHI